jgi:hypothetical protein
MYITAALFGVLILKRQAPAPAAAPV